MSAITWGNAALAKKPCDWATKEGIHEAWNNDARTDFLMLENDKLMFSKSSTKKYRGKKASCIVNRCWKNYYGETECKVNVQGYKYSCFVENVDGEKIVACLLDK